MPKVGLVTTTIYVPKLLDAYMQNAKACGHSDVLFVVTGDKKTPPEAKTFCIETGKKHGFEMVYMDVEEQNTWMKDYPELDAHLPWNSIQRRNVSILYAYKAGCDSIITIDDDNLYIEGQDFVGDHTRDLNQNVAREQVSSSSGWYNICETLEERRGYTFYHRGYPMKQRWPEWPPIVRSEVKTQKVMVNAGLWLEDPDVDAITRLTNDIHAIRYTKTNSFTLAPGTWCPFNSQNTALAREVIDAYPLSPLVGRYDDIWASYIVRRITDHLGHVVEYGYPLVKQERNPHNYFVDHDHEKVGLEFTDTFCQWLREFTLTGDTYRKCFGEIITQLQARLTAETANLKADKIKIIEGLLSTLVAWDATITRLNA